MMVQQAVDSKFTNSESGLASADKPLPVAVKKTVLRDLQNENRVVTTNTGNPPFQKEKTPTNDTVKVSGTKRPSPERSISPPHHQSPTGNAGNGHLVYVRRKPDGELGKNTPDNTSNNAECVQSRQFHLVEEAIQRQSVQVHPQIKDQKVSCSPAAPPNTTASLMSAFGKPLYSVPLGYPGKRSSAECNYHPPSASVNPNLDTSKEAQKKHWQERYVHLQMLLKHYDQSDQEDYLQRLRALPSIELSKHAFDLEKRSIQLSLEEAKELQRLEYLNPLGKSTKIFKAPSAQQEQSQK